MCILNKSLCSNQKLINDWQAEVHYLEHKGLKVLIKCNSLSKHTSTYPKLIIKERSGYLLLSYGIFKCLVDAVCRLHSLYNLLG